MLFWTAEPMTAQGPRKGESSSSSMRYGLRPQPARLVRGSSRRIMSMRFRPANIRVINRRVCSSAVIGPAVQSWCSKSASQLRAKGNETYGFFPLWNPHSSLEDVANSEHCRKAQNEGKRPTTTTNDFAEVAKHNSALPSRRAVPAGTLRRSCTSSKQQGRLPPAAGAGLVQNKVKPGGA
jgi:hypothetical protein